MSSDNGNGEGGGPKLLELGVRDKEQAAHDEFQRKMPVLIANADLIAKIRRANYEALVREGFTEAQALDLCWR